MEFATGQHDDELRARLLAAASAPPGAASPAVVGVPVVRISRPDTCRGRITVRDPLARPPEVPARTMRAAMLVGGGPARPYTTGQMARRGGTGELIRSTDTDAWSKALSRFPWRRRIICRATTSSLSATARATGTCFVFHDHDQIAFPLLVRSVAEVSGLDGTSFNDATSVYGYPGPISSSESPGAMLSPGSRPRSTTHCARCELSRSTVA